MQNEDKNLDISSSLVKLVDDQQPASMRSKVLAFEAEMAKMPQLELKVEHHFSPGVYARTLHIPKDTILTGKIHKYAQLNILVQGEMSVLVGEEVKRIKAPFTIVSPAGTKRIAHAHEDCIWITVHGTEETDLDKIEDHFIAKDEAEYLEFCNKNQLLLDL